MAEFKKQEKSQKVIGVFPAGLPNLPRNRRALKRIVGKKHRTTATKVTGELNQQLNSPVSNETARRVLNKAGYHGRAAFR